jgi:hypothetical protein
MIDVRRLRGIMIALAAVSVAMGTCSLSARAVVGSKPAWLSSGDSTLEDGQYDLTGGLISGVSRLKNKGDGPERLGVILGSSAVRQGVDTEVLKEIDGGRTRWLSLAANGANVGDLAALAGLLFRSGLKPETLVLALHPGLLARTDTYLSDDAASHFFAPEVSGGLGRLTAPLSGRASALVRIAFPQRVRLNQRFRQALLGTRTALFASLNVPTGSLFRADRDPFRDRAETLANADTAVRDWQMGQWRDKGWFERGAYAPGDKNARALVSMVRDARGLGASVIVVLMPESSPVRASVPPEAMRCLREALGRGFGPDAPPVVDLREALPDDRFSDTIHPDERGRREFSGRLTGVIGERGKTSVRR